MTHSVQVKAEVKAERGYPTILSSLNLNLNLYLHLSGGH
jgi:hypothetical protein